jgi:hypothetical protein
VPDSPLLLSFLTPEHTTTEGAKIPATFTGIGAELLFSSGDCTVDEEIFFTAKKVVLNCTEPSITYTKTPAEFTSKYVSAPKFVGKECKISKTFGEEVEEVIFTFDGSTMPDTTALASTIAGEVQKAVGTAGSTLASAHSQLKAQVQQFLGRFSGMGLA